MKSCVAWSLSMEMRLELGDGVSGMESTGTDERNEIKKEKTKTERLVQIIQNVATRKEFD